MKHIDTQLFTILKLVYFEIFLTRILDTLLVRAIEISVGQRPTQLRPHNIRIIYTNCRCKFN
jgi:hypothetical protein